MRVMSCYGRRQQSFGWSSSSVVDIGTKYVFPISRGYCSFPNEAVISDVSATLIGIKK
jgi:hypothetical protein